ncbi:MAG: polysaccharide pyruvyl transferase CsaB [Armatimonadetes bacterium]|nr:polysaccharide pyruvyl transferase CsaB [Armatimonadota bacterium]
MRALLSGYYGFGNLGDEAILAAIAQELVRALPEVEIEVLSGAPADTKSAYGLEACDRWRLSCLWRALRRSDVLIQGGGGLLQDTTSTLSPAYYLGVLLAAWLVGKPYAIFCQGIGPLRRWLWQRLAVFLLSRAQLLIVRDQESAESLLRMGVRKPAEVAGDPALLLEPTAPEETQRWLKETGARLPDQYWLVVPRQIASVEEAVTHSVEALARSGRLVAVLPFQVADEALARQTAARARGLALTTPKDPRIAASLVAQAQGVLAVRLHALIFAAVAGKESFGVDYDPKVAAFCQAVGYPHSPQPTAQQVTAWATQVEDGHGFLQPEAVERMQNSVRYAFGRLAELLRQAGAASSA